MKNTVDFSRNMYYKKNANGRPLAINRDLCFILINQFGWRLGKGDYEGNNRNRIYKPSKANEL